MNRHYCATVCSKMRPRHPVLRNNDPWSCGFLGNSRQIHTDGSTRWSSLTLVREEHTERERKNGELRRPLLRSRVSPPGPRLHWVWMQYWMREIIQFISICLPSQIQRDVNIESYETLIILIVLNGCKSWSRNITQWHRFSTFENKVLQRILVPNREELTGEGKIAHFVSWFIILYFPRYYWVINSMGMRR